MSKKSFQSDSVAYKLLNDDWSDLTAKQIAEVLGVRVDAVYKALRKIQSTTGLYVDYANQRRSGYRKRDDFPKNSLAYSLLQDDWSDLTVDQIAEVFDVKVPSVYNAIYEIRISTGKAISYRRKKNGRRLNSSAQQEFDKWVKQSHTKERLYGKL